MQWQPVETAPKDENPILAVIGGRVTIVQWSDDLEGWMEGEDWCPFSWVTHWMPLPEPPK